jgi:signal-transduction protein with cAMP-binding, CBS, and nucleotidyltransferase domain
MFCRLYTPGRVVISYKSNVKEVYFIRQGIVEVYNNDNDEIKKERPILYLPKFSYFGDYQILQKLKSNVVIKTLAEYPNPGEGQKKTQQMEALPDIIFMCVNKKELLDLCDLFPQTADNIKRKAMERRKRFIRQKNMNSKKYWNKRGKELLGPNEIR